MERTGGEARYQVYQSLDSETPLGSGESTRTTRNGVNFRNARTPGVAVGSLDPATVVSTLSPLAAIKRADPVAVPFARFTVS